MKKTNKHADGTEEVLEGDPEELRKYEDLQKPQDQAPITESPKKPGILHGSEALDGVPLTDSEKELVRFVRTFKLPEPVKTSPWPGRDPIWVVSCSICGRVACTGSCYVPPWYTVTYGQTTTSDKVELRDDILKDDGGPRLKYSLADVLMGAPFEVKTNGN